MSGTSGRSGAEAFWTGTPPPPSRAPISPLQLLLSLMMRGGLGRKWPMLNVLFLLSAAKRLLSCRLLTATAICEGDLPPAIPDPPAGLSHPNDLPLIFSRKFSRDGVQMPDPAGLSGTVGPRIARTRGFANSALPTPGGSGEGEGAAPGERAPQLSVSLMLSSGCRAAAAPSRVSHSRSTPLISARSRRACRGSRTLGGRMQHSNLPTTPADTESAWAGPRSYPTPPPSGKLPRQARRPPPCAPFRPAASSWDDDGKAKVPNLGRAVRRQQDVIGLEVPVDDRRGLLVKVVHALANVERPLEPVCRDELLRRAADV
eukprot:CAMPEP_0182914742 /NCGR_PEP_ID=MMETSP0034_2-20130328/38725_1 /TAXON_ID=156128 /ORGANISM="Nephroselmis pyriformis, Strain CCMP717" /LENGTH=315 /DNA_ID=CAMNT_0025051525 /DNA_START=862 /DNA_END=1811 /DNA_ORIENTATION=-